MPPSADDGLEKSATLLIALGEDHAAEVLKHLGPREVQKLGHAMAALKTVPPATTRHPTSFRASCKAARPPASKA